MLQSKREELVSYVTPLRKFTGHFDEYNVMARKGKLAKEGQQDVHLKFSNMKDIISDSPYEYKTTVLALKYSDALKSGWVLFENSIATLLNKPEGTVGIDNVVGMDLTMEREDDYFFFHDDKTGKDAKGTVWRVVSGTGTSSATTPMEKALAMLNGETKAGFPAKAIADSVIKTDTALCNSLIEGTFFDSKEVTEMYDMEYAEEDTEKVNPKYVKKS